MAVFTCITEVRDSFHLSQHTTTGPERALRAHIAVLPCDDGAEPPDDEVEWLTRISSGAEPVELLPVAHCRGTWLWLKGARYVPPYLTYIVCTDVSSVEPRPR